MQQIRVKVIPNSEWVLDGTNLYCQHDEGYKVEMFEVDTTVNGEHDTYKSPTAVCVDPVCDEVLDIDSSELVPETNYEED